MTLADELGYMSAAELAGKIRRRELSPVDVVETFIQRIEERNKSLNAFIYVKVDEAISRAQEAEQAVMDGDELGLLHGVPTALKDLAGFRPGWIETFGGIATFKDNVVNAYCTYSERMEKAGALFVGKTNSPVMGFRGTCDNFLYGPTRNPFDLTKNSGGSSGGSAAAVADGLLPIAHGTDGGGSIRIPAAWCGVYGFQASFGRIPFVSRPNAFGGTVPFLYEGPITRTVEDAVLALNVLTGHNPRDPFNVTIRSDFRQALSRSVKGMKIAYSPNLDVFPVDPKVRNVVTQAVNLFVEAGAHVEEVRVGIQRDQQQLSDLWCRMIMPFSIESFENFKRQGIDLLKDDRQSLPHQFIEWFEKASRMTIHDFLRDQQMRTEIYDVIENVFEQYDLLITPTLACLPVDNAADGDTVGPTHINGEAVNPLIGWCLTYVTNFSGHPAASIPAGLADGRYPVGMQIIGKRYADIDVLTASAVFERMKPWRHNYKLCANRSLE